MSLLNSLEYNPSQGPWVQGPSLSPPPPPSSRIAWLSPLSHAFCSIRGLFLTALCIPCLSPGKTPELWKRQRDGNSLPQPPPFLAFCLLKRENKSSKLWTAYQESPWTLAQSCRTGGWTCCPFGSTSAQRSPGGAASCHFSRLDGSRTRLRIMETTSSTLHAQ